MAETTVAENGSHTHPGQKAASGLGGWFQKNKTMAIAVGIVVVVIIFYVFYHNSSSASAANNAANGTSAAGSGAGISPADLAGLLSSIPQGPAGPTGARGPAGPPGKRGRPGKPGKPKPKHHATTSQMGISTHPVQAPVNNTIKAARPPVHPLSQKPAVASRR